MTPAKLPNPWDKSPVSRWDITDFLSSQLFLQSPQNFNRTFTAIYGNTLNSVNGSSGEIALETG